MTIDLKPIWEDKRTDETRQVEVKLKEGKFDQVDAYRYNSASIRVRVIDKRFEGLSVEQRDGMVEPYLDQLDERTQSHIVMLFTFAPSELQEGSKHFTKANFLNLEFEDPSPSNL